MKTINTHIDRAEIDGLLVEYGRVFHKYKCATNEDDIDKWLSRMDKIREYIIDRLFTDPLAEVLAEIRKGVEKKQSELNILGRNNTNVYVFNTYSDVLDLLDNQTK